MRLRRTASTVPRRCVLCLAIPAALGALLVVGYLRPGSSQINQFAPTPSRWYGVMQPGGVHVYHFAASVPEASAPLFARLKASAGTWGRGALDLGPTRVYAIPSATVTTGHVHQGGITKLATPFTRWSVGLWKPFLLSCLLFLPAAASLRRRRAQLRREAGLCTRCGYDLTGNVSGVCPECGGPA